MNFRCEAVEAKLDWESSETGNPARLGIESSTMSSIADRPFKHESTPNQDIQVLNWPLVQDGWRSVAYVFVTVSTGMAVYWGTQNGLTTAFAISALMISMWRFWLPVQFRLSHLGIIQTCLGRRHLYQWKTIRRCDALHNGLLILFNTDRSSLALFSSLYIGWRDQREQMLAFVESRARLPARDSNAS